MEKIQLTKIQKEIIAGVILLLLFIFVAIISQLPFGLTGVAEFTGMKRFTYEVVTLGMAFAASIIFSFLAATKLKPETLPEVMREGLIWGTMVIVLAVVTTWMVTGFEEGINFGSYFAVMGHFIGPAIYAKTQKII